MYLAFLAIGLPAAVPMTVASMRFNRMRPSLGLRVIAALISLATLAAAVAVSALITGHVSPAQLVPGYFVAGLVDLAVIEVLRRRMIMH